MRIPKRIRFDTTRGDEERRGTMASDSARRGTRDVLRHAMPNMRRCDITCVAVPGVGTKQERGRAVAQCYGYRSRVAKSGKMGGYGSRAIAGLSSCTSFSLNSGVSQSSVSYSPSSSLLCLCWVPRVCLLSRCRVRVRGELRAVVGRLVPRLGIPLSSPPLNPPPLVVPPVLSLSLAPPLSSLSPLLSSLASLLYPLSVPRGLVVLLGLLWVLALRFGPARPLFGPVPDRA
jgi:hypothetical protein